MWDILFSATNTLALVMWIGLILLPRWETLLTIILYAGIGILCATYVVCITLALSGVVPAGEGGADFTTIEGVRTIFATDVGVVIGWTHYLAFDLFVGLWIARDADAKGFSRWLQAPILLATFLAGPVGLFIWLVLREPAARRAKRRSSPNAQ